MKFLPPRQNVRRPAVTRPLKFLGEPHASGSTLPPLSKPVMVPPSRPSRKGAWLKAGEILCLLVALACLGRVVQEYGGATIFQNYQSWRFDHIMRHEAPAPTPLLIRWIDRARSVFGKEPAAPPKQNKLPPPAPPPEGHASAPRVPPVANGDIIGRMEIPRVGISVMVLEGDNADVLRKGAGHVPSTSLPGGPGNVVIAGHRDTFFRALQNIHKDDEIDFTTKEGVHSYQVGSIQEVGPGDVQVLKASDHPTLTLVTCYPFDYIGSAPERFVVQAAEILPSGRGVPAESLTDGQRALDSPSGN